MLLNEAERIPEKEEECSRNPEKIFFCDFDLMFTTLK